MFYERLGKRRKGIGDTLVRSSPFPVRMEGAPHVVTPQGKSHGWGRVILKGKRLSREEAYNVILEIPDDSKRC